MVAEGDKKNEPFVVALQRQRGPGAGKYLLPTTLGLKGHDVTRKAEPAYSMGQKLGSSLIKSTECSPGPIYFIDSPLTRNGKKEAPKYTISGRPRELSVFKTPGPDQYFYEKVPPHLPNAPKYSLTSRSKYRKMGSNPAPNAYSLPSMLGSKIPNKFASASYSISGRLKNLFDQDLSKTPGSAHYKVVDPNLYKTRAPTHFMSTRVFMPTDRTLKPGPGAYCPEKVTANLPRAPQYTTGIRHSEYITPLITKDDFVEDFHEES